MDTDRKPGRKGDSWNEKKKHSQETVPIRNFIRKLNVWKMYLAQ